MFWRRSGPRPPHRWRPREVERAFVIGFLGITFLPEDGTLRPDRRVWGAAVFDREAGLPLLWRSSAAEVFCGTRGSLWEACEEGREWVRNAERDAEEMSEREPEPSSSGFAAFGILGEFERVWGGGFLRLTMRSLPEPEPHSSPAEPGGLGDWELWDRDADRPVEPGAAITTREALDLPSADAEDHGSERR